MKLHEAIQAQGFNAEPGTPPAFDNYKRPDGLFAQVRYEAERVYVYNTSNRLMFIMSFAAIEQASIDVFGLTLKEKLAAG